MTDFERNLKQIDILHQHDLDDYENLKLLYSLSCYIQPHDPERAVREMKTVRNNCADMLRRDDRYIELYWQVMLFLARNKDLDSYLLFLERYRDPEEAYYLPRRKQLINLGIIEAMQRLIDDKIDILSLSMPPGTGKAQPLLSKVLTPYGFRRMGDLKIGDEIISGENRVSHVIGIYPQGVKPVYEVEFDDGSKCKCTDEHLWKCQTRDDRRRSRGHGGEKYRVIELKEMMQNLYVEGGKRKNYSIDYVEPIDFPKKDLPLHPYVMGVLLGDGGFTQTSVGVSFPDDFIREKVERLLPDGDCLSHRDEYDYRIKRKQRNNQQSDTKQILQRYYLDGCGSSDKFIPYGYLLASKEDRYELLAGLLDTDGCINGSTIEFDSTSRELASNVVELVHSLGGFASIRYSETWYTKDGERVPCKDSYRVLIEFPDTGNKYFSLPRKADRYNPKRKTIKRFVKSVRYLYDDYCQCIMIDDPCHLYITDDYIITHNTTLAEMFLSGWIGWDPDACNLFSSHSGHVTRMVYDVICNIIGADLKRGQVAEYAWREIFPDVEIQDINAKEETINLGKFKPFKSITFRAIGASQTGVTRADGLLYCDDLCSGIEEALSKVRLDKLWQKYNTDLKTRKKGGRYDKNDAGAVRRYRKVKELHIATRWSVWDCIGRLQKQYGDDARCQFIAFPDINPETGKSNFNYLYGVGFDEKYFEDIQNSLDDITYKCLYKNEPIEREGLLYDPDLLRRFNRLPPDKEPDAIWAFLDPKGSGVDYNTLGVFVQYGKDYYLTDVVFRNIDPYLLDDLNADCLVRNNVQVCQIESNKEGVRTGDEIQKLVDERGGRCVIEKKYSTANKETRIIVSSKWVIQHVLFREARSVDNPDGYMANSEYGQFMAALTSYSQLAKNTHDDAPDMVSMLAIHESGDMSPVAAIYSGVM